ncbi:MAG: gamma carbonic anhydrase family protein [Veillonella sp.]|nr:gamma carbonic anhydrase family protein [Veillonella sp.]
MFTFKGPKPSISADACIMPGAHVIGEVEVKEGASIWYNAVLRGDAAKIVVGKHSNVQDNATIHVDFDMPCILGNHVTVGHNAIVHAAIVEDDVMIGMGATVLNGARIGRGAMIAAGALVKEHDIIPPGALVVGVPGKVVRINEGQAEKLHKHAEMYVELWQKAYERIED